MLRAQPTVSARTVNESEIEIENMTIVDIDDFTESEVGSIIKKRNADSQIATKASGAASCPIVRM